MSIVCSGSREPWAPQGADGWGLSSRLPLGSVLWPRQGVQNPSGCPYSVALALGASSCKPAAGPRGSSSAVCGVLGAGGSGFSSCAAWRRRRQRLSGCGT